MKIHGYSQLTLLDYPGKLACTIFCGNCNFRCPFCHNAMLVMNPDRQPAIPEDKILEHLSQRTRMLEGICVTGGEPTTHSDLPDFLRKLRKLPFLIKLDTNGTHPDMLEELISEKLIDYVAMDIKSSPDGYAAATGLSDISMNEIFRSTDLLLSGRTDYEFRTTVVDGLHTEDDFKAISHWIKGAKAYYLQEFRNQGDLINPVGFSVPSHQTMEHYREIMLPYVPNTILRGAE